MSLKSLSYAHILAIANIWREIGGSREIEIGALEPLLWRDGQHRIHDVVSALTKNGFRVSMTTNGQMLDIFTNKLGNAGLALIRTSWHSTDPLIFREISGGYGNYNRFMRGVMIALESGIKIAFNRVLLKGYVDDIPKQLEFIERYKSRLKLYTLLWTPRNSSTYKRFYQGWRPVIRAYVLPHTIKIARIKKRIGRIRLQFHLAGGGSVEAKLGDKMVRNTNPCLSCPFRDDCEEEFGDYVRVDPHLRLYFCYMRRDLGLQISDYFSRPVALKRTIQRIFGNIEHLLAVAPLRLTITPYCNFNCRAPGAQEGWCMEKPGEFLYPKIRPSLLKNNQS